MDILTLGDFDNMRSPPRFLYKYLSSERVGNVLDGGTVRFAPLLDTNGTFEDRSIFDKLAGPKMLSLFAEQMDDIFFRRDDPQTGGRHAGGVGLRFFPPELVVQIAEQHNAGNFIGVLRRQMQNCVDTLLVPYCNAPENIKSHLKNWGVICFAFLFLSGWTARRCGRITPIITPV